MVWCWVLVVLVLHRFKHARKVVVEEPPRSMEALRELLSREINVGTVLCDDLILLG